MFILLAFVPLIVSGTDPLSETDSVSQIQTNTDPGPGEIPDILSDSLFNYHLETGAGYQAVCDSLTRISVKLRKEASRIDDPQERFGVQKQVMKVEDEILEMQEQANLHFNKMSAVLASWDVGRDRSRYILLDTVINDMKVYRYNLTPEFLARLDSLQQEPVQDASVPGFAILQSSPYSDENPFESEIDLPAGPFYRIQLAVYSRKLEPDHFGGLSPISTEWIEARKLTRYFAGKLKNLESANKALLEIQRAGYSDAFIVGYFNGKIVSLDKAAELEKQ